MASRFTLNRAGVTQLLNEAPARGVVDQASASIVDGAKAAVHHRTGKAARSYKVLPAVATHEGATGAAYTDDPVGSLIEFGTEDTAPQRPLTRGAQASGLKWKEEAK